MSQRQQRLPAKLGTRSAGMRLSRASFGEATLQISSSATLKSEILKASGDRNGLDRSGPEVEAIRKSIDALEAREGSLQQLDLTSTTWRLVYTNSKGNSSGKLGPFIGRVTQVFPGDTPAQYINKVQIGPFEAAVLAEYEYARKDRINVTFLNTTFKLGPFRYCKETTMKGHWTLKYADEELRILTSNQNNVFVLARVS
ncbi:hypothetical protein WJX72_002625 [[Myrmecia] bisecta]|uniref:Plastid lipid-associated protein/fibrillin conserved domain-containing protein n=1 Tax=[Myrmecia] bisecta TaxID=41462 RepID=A0AAW1Q2R6_9CHLO